MSLNSTRKIKVLYVEDEVDLLVVLEMSLQEIKNIEYKLVKNGEEAVKSMENEKFDVLITDHYLPGIQGIDVLEIAKKRFPNIKRFLITGSVLSSVFEDANLRGEPLYIFAKPVIIDQIFDKVFEFFI